MNRVRGKTGDLNLDHTLSTDIRYADDTTLITLISKKLRISTSELDAACEKRVLIMSVKGVTRC